MKTQALVSVPAFVTGKSCLLDAPVEIQTKIIEYVSYKLWLMMFKLWAR